MHRGMGIPTHEDKILQRAMVMLLAADLRGRVLRLFLRVPTSKSPHQALASLYAQCYEQDVAYVLDVDLRKYFDTIAHTHLREILHHRVGDGVITRLIKKMAKSWRLGGRSRAYSRSWQAARGCHKPLTQ